MPDANGQNVLLESDLIAAMHLTVAEDPVSPEEFHGVFGQQLGQCIRRGTQIGEPTSFSFDRPFLGVAVSIEYDVSMRVDDVLEKVLYRGIEISPLGELRLEIARDVVESLGRGSY